MHRWLAVPAVAAIATLATGSHLPVVAPAAIAAAAAMTVRAAFGSPKALRVQIRPPRRPD